MAQLVKNPPVTRETWVRSLGPEEPLEEGMAAHTSILAWEIPWREEPGGLQSTGSHSRTCIHLLIQQVFIGCLLCTKQHVWNSTLPTGTWRAGEARRDTHTKFKKAAQNEA